MFTLKALLARCFSCSCRATVEEAVSVTFLRPALRSPPLKPAHRTRPREGCWNAIKYADPLSHFEAEREVSARSGIGPGRHHFTSREAGLSHNETHAPPASLHLCELQAPCAGHSVPSWSRSPEGPLQASMDY